MKFYKKWQIKVVFIVLIAFTIVFAISKNDYYKKLSHSLSLYENVYQILVSNYVNQIDIEEFTENAINKALNDLDPYTVFLTKEEKDPIEQLAKGTYGGIGISISMRNDTLTAISPMDGGPAIRAGIIPGDQIIKVDSISTIGLSLSKCSKLLRGKKGTKVNVTFHRPGLKDIFEIKLIRDKIKVPIISYSGMLDDKTGYIRLIGFSRGAAKEVKKNIQNFSQNNDFSNLIFDLRGNPGGLLQEALEISEYFTDPGDTLLITKGRMKSASRVFISRKKPIIDSHINIAALIDRGSASASEIVAGIIQDTDRGIVVGSTSFGKGLVQQVKDLDKNHSIKITNAKYYTPSGRCIQKPGFIKDSSLVTISNDEDTLFFSKNGRQLKGGGGIAPDFVIERKKMPKFVQQLWIKNKFYSFAIKYKSEKGTLPDYKNINDEIINLFEQYLISENFSVDFDEEKQLKKIKKEIMKYDQFKDDSNHFQVLHDIFKSMKINQFNDNKQFIKKGLASEFATLSGGLSTRTQANLIDDEVLKKALTIFKDNSTYNTTLGYLK